MTRLSLQEKWTCEWLLDKAKSAAASGLESAKSAVNDKLEQRQNTKQDAWKAQVLVEGPQDTEFPQPQFRPFQEWADIFEPKASASTSGPVQKAIQNKLAESAQKAREMMLAQMQKLMIDRFMMTMFEVSSKVFTPIEDQVREAHSPAAAVLNALNGVLLSYRFGLTGSAEQFEYLRSVAIGHLVEGLSQVMHGADDPAQKLRELEELICLKVSEKKAEVRAVVEATPLFSLDNLEAHNTTVAGVDVVQAAGQHVDVGMVNEGLKEFQDFAKMFLLAQMDALVEQVPARVAELLAVISGRLQQGSEIAHAANVEDLADDVERVHTEVRGKVELGVSGIVKILNSMMMPAGSVGAAGEE